MSGINKSRWRDADCLFKHGGERMNAKEYLNQAYRLNELIDSDAQELERLRELAGRIGGSNFGERVQTSKNADTPFVKYLGDIIDMEGKLQRELCELVVLKKQILSALERMTNRDERLLLTYRYMDNVSWEEIAGSLSVSMRTVHRIHSAALQNFQVPE